MRKIYEKPELSIVRFDNINSVASLNVSSPTGTGTTGVYSRVGFSQLK